MKTVKVTVSDGVIQHVEVPDGVLVIVRDYDVDGFDPSLLQRDRGGTLFMEDIWTSGRTTDADIRD